MRSCCVSRRTRVSAAQPVEFCYSLLSKQTFELPQPPKQKTGGCSGDTRQAGIKERWEKRRGSLRWRPRPCGTVGLSQTAMSCMHVLGEMCHLVLLLSTPFRVSNVARSWGLSPVRKFAPCYNAYSVKECTIKTCGWCATNSCCS